MAGGSHWLKLTSSFSRIKNESGLMGSNLEVKHGGEKIGPWSRELGCLLHPSPLFASQRMRGVHTAAGVFFDRIVYCVVIMQQLI